MRRSSYIFKGRITKTEVGYWDPGFPLPEHLAYVEIVENYLGDLEGEYVLYGGSGSSCRPYFYGTGEVLVFAEGVYAGRRIGHRSCGNSQYLTDGTSPDLEVVKAAMPEISSSLEPQLYFSFNEQERIERIGLDGRNPTLVTEFGYQLGSGPVRGIAISGNRLFWVNWHGVYTMGLDGSVPEKISYPWPADAGLATAGPETLVFRRDFEEGSLATFSPGESGEEWLYSTVVEGANGGFTANRSSFFWSENGLDRIYASDHAGENTVQLLDLSTTFGAGVYNPVGFAATDSHLYWTDDSEDTIHALDLESGEATRLVTLNRAFGPADYVPTGIVVYDGTVYWTDSGEGGVHGIYAVGSDGSDPRRIHQPLTGKPRWLSLFPGREPTAAEVLEIESVRKLGGSRASITWRSREGFAYRVERSVDLELWEELAVLAGGTGPTTSFNDFEAPDRQAFYRVVLSEVSP